MNMRVLSQSLKFVFAVALATVGGACGKAEGAGPPNGGMAKRGRSLDEAVVDYRGIYEVTSMTLNQGSCTDEGKNVMPAPEGFFVVQRAKEKYLDAIQVTGCRDLATCKLTTTQTPASLMHRFDAEVDDGLAGHYVILGSQDGTKATCSDGESATLRMTHDGSGLRLEVRSTLVTYPADAKGMCSSEQVQKLTADKQCTRLTVVRGKKVADLQ